MCNNSLERYHSNDKYPVERTCCRAQDSSTKHMNTVRDLGGGGNGGGNGGKKGRFEGGREREGGGKQGGRSGWEREESVVTMLSLPIIISNHLPSVNNGIECVEYQVLLSG